VTHIVKNGSDRFPQQPYQLLTYSLPHCPLD
jgi:hypothetical protein